MSIDGEQEVADALANIMMSAEQRNQFKQNQAACVASFKGRKNR